jgi:hypothetical protein
MNKRAGRAVVLLGLLAWPVASAFPQCLMRLAAGQGDVSGTKFQVDVEKVQLADVSREGVRLGISLSVLSGQDVRVQQVSFENLRANDVPVYIAPSTEPFRLVKGQSVRFPRPLQVSIYYRDLDTVQPLVVMLQEGRIRLDGTLTMDLELPVAAKVALLSRRGRVRVNFRQALPAELPGGELVRKGAIAVVETAGKALETARSGVASGLNLASERRRRLLEEYAPALLLAQARFTLRQADGAEMSYDCFGVGFRISPAQFIVTKELVGPWKYDRSIADALHRKQLRLQNNSIDLWVWPAGTKLGEGANEASASALRLSRGDIRVVRTPADQTETVLSPGVKRLPRKVRVLRREAATNVALLEFRGTVGLPNVAELKRGAETGPTRWDSVALFRFPRGAAAEQVQPDILFLPAVRDGARLRLLTPVDSSAWGSPLVSSEGVVGVVQNENTGVALQEVYRVLKLR